MEANKSFVKSVLLSPQMTCKETLPRFKGPCKRVDPTRKGILIDWPASPGGTAQVRSPVSGSMVMPPGVSGSFLKERVSWLGFRTFRDKSIAKVGVSRISILCCSKASMVKSLWLAAADCLLVVGSVEGVCRSFSGNVLGVVTLVLGGSFS